METPKNCILYDWLTFSAPGWTFDRAVDFLNLRRDGWVKGLASRYHYAERAQLNGVHVHYTPESLVGKYNAGVCVELSGQGCRCFETFSGMDMQELCDKVRAAGLHVSRVDVAYDDFDGHIDIQKMASQAHDFHFTSRLQTRKIVDEARISETEVSGVTVSHGSRQSRIFIRCYDKKYERGRFDLDHWVRLEIMFRDENAVGFLDAPGGIGEKWAGVLRNYLMYREPSSDTNKRRWEVSPWWSELLGAAEALKVSSKKDLDYNISKFREYIYGHMRKSFLTMMKIDGPFLFMLNMLRNASEIELNDKQSELVRRFGHADPNDLQRFQDFLDEFWKEIHPHDFDPAAYGNDEWSLGDSLQAQQAERFLEQKRQDAQNTELENDAASFDPDELGGDQSDGEPDSL